MNKRRLGQQTATFFAHATGLLSSFLSLATYAPGLWDDRKRNHKPVVPLYLCLDISNNLSRATFLPSPFLPQFSCPKNVSRQEQKALWAQGLWQMWQIKMRNTFCWNARMNILPAFAHSTSLSSHLNMRMAQLVWGPFWISLMSLVLPFS